MKYFKRAVLLLCVFLFLLACKKDSYSSTQTTSSKTSTSGSSGSGGSMDCQNDPSKRKGAMCKDGTTSSATGSGACSQHGGVDYWICK